MDSLEKAADQVAREHIGGLLRQVDDFDVAVARNAILDCLISSDEPDFIAKACANSLIGSQSRKVVRAIAPHLVAMAGQTWQAWRA